MENRITFALFGLLLFATVVVVVAVEGIERPPGLRPAKALGEPAVETTSATHEPSEPKGITPTPPPNARVPPNLSLRSRMIAALNSNSNSNDTNGSGNKSTPLAGQLDAPIVFEKGKGKAGRKGAIYADKPQVSSTPARVESAKISTIPPPPGKDYGVNTILLTNLVDSRGNVLRGVNSVPVKVPASPTTTDIQNSKAGRGTSSRVDTGAEGAQPIKFGPNSSERSI